MEENYINDLISEVNRLIDGINKESDRNTQKEKAAKERAKTKIQVLSEKADEKKSEQKALESSIKKIQDSIKWNESYTEMLKRAVEVEEEAIESRKDEIRYTASQIEISKKLFQEKQKQLAHLQETSDVLQNTIQENIERMTELPDVISSEAEKIVQSLSDERKAASRRISGLVYMNESYTSEISKINQELTRLRTVDGRKKPSAENMSRIAELEDMKLMAEMYRERNQGKIGEEIAFKKYLKDPKVIQEFIDLGTKELREELQTLVQTIPFLTDAFDQLQGEIKDLTPDVDNLQNTVNSLTTQFNNTMTAQKQSVGKLAGYNNTLAQLGSQLGNLNNVFNKKKTALSNAIGNAVTAFTQKMAAITDELERALTNLAYILHKYTNDIREIQQQLGISAGTAVEVKFGNIFESLKSFVSSGAMVSQKQVQDSRVNFQNEFGGVLTAKAAADIAQRSVEEGITSQQQATARRVFMTQTGGDLGAAKSQESNFIASFEQRSLTSKDAMEAIAKYSELLARNGTRFSKSFAEAAAAAKKIGVDLSKVDQVGDNIIGNFEGFLESQAELGAMGFGFDSNKLAQIAETGDTGALFNELRSQLSSTGKDITKLRRSEQLAISEAFGISMSELQRMAGQDTGSGEKTIEDVQRESNDLLSKIFNVVEKAATAMITIHGLLGMANSLLGGILKNTSTMGGLTGSLTGGKGSPMSRAAGIFQKGGMKGLTRAAPTLVKGALRSASGAAGLAGLVGGISEYLNSGDIMKSLLRGGLNLAGAGIGGFAGSFLGPLGTVGGGIAGSLVGDTIADYLLNAENADDMVSKAGYGERMLVTPTATVALNNQDNIIAYADDMVSADEGIKKYSKGELAPAPQITNQVDLAKLEAKMDQLVRTLSNMNVYIDSTRVGKILVNNSDAGTKVGVLGIQQTTAL